jgi:hypothetical protein
MSDVDINNCKGHMTSAAYFPQLSQTDVSGELETTYEDIRRTLRVPWVAFGCRVLATFPGYLPLAWRRSADAFITRFVEQAADELRERSILGIGSLPNLRQHLGEAGFSDSDLEKVRRVLNAFNYGNPKYLLLITAWSECLQMRQVGGADVSKELRASVPKGHPRGMDPLLPLVDANNASAEVQALLKRAADVHFHHGPASDFQALANWPTFLEIATDEALAPVARQALYDAKSRELVTRARELVRGLPGTAGVPRSELMTSLTPTEIAGLTGVLFMYQRFIADITISVVHITACLDGADAASRSAFPV